MQSCNSSSIEPLLDALAAVSELPQPSNHQPLTTKDLQEQLQYQLLAATDLQEQLQYLPLEATDIQEPLQYLPLEATDLQEPLQYQPLAVADLQQQQQQQHPQPLQPPRQQSPQQLQQAYDEASTAPCSTIDSNSDRLVQCCGLNSDTPSTISLSTELVHVDYGPCTDDTRPLCPKCVANFEDLPPTYASLFDDAGTEQVEGADPSMAYCNSSIYYYCVTFIVMGTGIVVIFGDTGDQMMHGINAFFGLCIILMSFVFFLVPCFTKNKDKNEGKSEMETNLV